MTSMLFINPCINKNAQQKDKKIKERNKNAFVFMQEISD